MQLALLVQLSIALLAGELAGMLPIGAWTGACIALAAPIVVLVVGALLARRAGKLMDQRVRGGGELLFAFNARAPWLAAICMAVAAASDLHRAFAPSVGNATVVVFLVACGIATTLAAYANAWTIERRLRESSLMRELDSAMPVHPMPSRGAFVLAQARAGLVPLLAPLIVPMLLGEAAAWIVAREFPGMPERADLARVGGSIGGALLLFVLVPVIVPPLLGLRRLAPGSMRDELEALAKDAGVGVREIWVWPTDGLIANAAVMGVLPGMRCVMLSDCLLECMTREQVRAVMAHELGHVVRRHLPWMLAVILACWTLAGAAVEPVAQGIWQRATEDMADGSREGLAQVVSLARDGTVLLLGILAFGFASRRFERQADTFAVQLLSARESREDATPESVDAMVGALGAVALLNHVPPSRPSWRHGSIAWRQEYLRTLVGRRCDGFAIDRLVAVLCWGSLCAVIAAFALGMRVF